MLFSVKVFINLNTKISGGFLGFNIKLSSLMFGTVIFSFLCGLKIKSFVLESFNESLLILIESVSSFSLLFKIQDILGGHL